MLVKKKSLETQTDAYLLNRQIDLFLVIVVTLVNNDFEKEKFELLPTLL